MHNNLLVQHLRKEYAEALARNEEYDLEKSPSWNTEEAEDAGWCAGVYDVIAHLAALSDYPHRCDHE